MCTARPEHCCLQSILTAISDWVVYSYGAISHVPSGIHSPSGYCQYRLPKWPAVSHSRPNTKWFLHTWSAVQIICHVQIIYVLCRGTGIWRRSVGQIAALRTRMARHNASCQDDTSRMHSHVTKDTVCEWAPTLHASPGATCAAHMCAANTYRPKPYRYAACTLCESHEAHPPGPSAVPARHAERAVRISYM